jgi:hypothetical protein
VTLAFTQRRLRRPTSGALTVIVLVSLVVAALAVRVDGLGDAPTDFVPERQYHSALLARGYYFDQLDSAPRWKRRLAELSSDQEELIEPLAMELTASLAYQVLGGERLWFPRLLSALFWVAGGVLLYLTALHFASRAGALTIGRIARHSDSTFVLGQAEMLEYHGWLFGVRWPDTSDLTVRARSRGDREAELTAAGAEARFRRELATRRPFRARRPRYFIVEDVSDLWREEGLRNYLRANFRAAVRSDSYVVFDLTRRAR